MTSTCENCGIPTRLHDDGVLYHFYGYPGIDSIPVAVTVERAISAGGFTLAVLRPCTTGTTTLRLAVCSCGEWDIRCTNADEMGILHLRVHDPLAAAQVILWEDDDERGLWLTPDHEPGAPRGVRVADPQPGGFAAAAGEVLADLPPLTDLPPHCRPQAACWPLLGQLTWFRTGVTSFGEELMPWPEAEAFVWSPPIPADRT